MVPLRVELRPSQRHSSRPRRQSWAPDYRDDPSPAHQPGSWSRLFTGATFPGASKAVADLREAAVSETHDTKDVLAALAARKSPVRPF